VSFFPLLLWPSPLFFQACIQTPQVHFESEVSYSLAKRNVFRKSSGETDQIFEKNTALQLTKAWPTCDSFIFFMIFTRIFIRKGSFSGTNDTSLCVCLLDEDANSKREIIVL